MTPGVAPGPERLYELAPCGLLVAEPSGAILAVNDTLCHWLQYERHELVGAVRFPELLTMGGRIFHQTHIAPLLRIQGSVAEVKLQMRRRDRHPLPVMLNAAERKDGDRTLLHVAVFVAEDRHKYEQELLAQRQRAEQLLAQHEEDQRELAAARRQAEERALFAEQMVGIVSHDLRNPLGTIRMSASLIGLMPLAEQQRTALQRIERGTQRAERLISDLLDVTQARLGRGLRVRKARVDVHEVIADAVQDWSTAFSKHDIRHHRAGAGECEADADRLVQAVGNLVRNAASYGDPAAPIDVSTERTPGALRLAVHNGGEPIDPQLLARLFEPMVRDGDSDEKGHGLGLGLYIVREIARAHGGQVEVSSSAAEGTTFAIVLTA